MKEVQVKIPEYLSIGQYQQMLKYERLLPLDKMLKTITLMSEYTEEQIKEWPIKTINEVASLLMDVSTGENEFHSIVEFKGQMLGFANISRSTFGEFIDLQALLKDPNTNLHEIAATLYRPITKHRFGTWSFLKKYGLNTANNKVEDPFKWYTIEKYDSELREERSEMMKEFPVQLILGAMGFTAVTGTLSLNDTLCLMNQMSKREKEFHQKEILETLGQTITGGGGLFTVSQRATYLKLQGIQQ